MDKLDSMFELQKKFQSRLIAFDDIAKNDSDKQQFINQMILAIHEEATEIAKKTPYKNPNYVKFGWRKTQIWNLEMYKMEIIDLFHFLMNLAIVVDMDADEFYTIYCRKNKVNHERQDGGY